MEPRAPDPQQAGIGFRIGVILLGLLIAGVAFSAINRGSDPGAAPAPAADRAVSVIAQGLPMVAGNDTAVRIGFDPQGGARLILRFTPSDARINLCPLTEIDAALPPATGCRADIFNGVRQELSPQGLRGVAFVLREGEARADLSIEYDARTRTLAARFPLLRPPTSPTACKDNGCNPFFELRPTRAGRFNASARWDGGDATLVLLQGSVLGRSETATGLPYAEPARRDGVTPLSIAASLSAPGEYALAFRAGSGTSASPLRSIQIDATWPE